MSAVWTRQPERGSTALTRFIVWLARSGGRPVARLLLYPICVYFVTFSRRPRRASAAYLGRLLGRRATTAEVFRHYHTFAATILDRVSFLTDDFERFDIRIHGLEAVQRPISDGRGCILLGAHLGSFEVTRSLAMQRGGVRLKILMYEENSRRTNAVLNALNPEIAASVISLGSPMAMMEAKEWLDSGGVLGILGDRTVGDGGDGGGVSAPFLGANADFPVGPYQLASITGAPVVMFCGLYKGGCRYDIHFQTLAERVRLRRRGGVGANGDSADDLARRYAATLERWCREAPYNWFNFYDFWRNRHRDA